jgi:hypothetical protein
VSAVDPATPCDLCSLPVGARPFSLATAEKTFLFCCEGCKGIYQMLHQINEAPGASQDNSTIAGKEKENDERRNDEADVASMGQGMGMMSHPVAKGAMIAATGYTAGRAMLPACCAIPCCCWRAAWPAASPSATCCTSTRRTWSASSPGDRHGQGFRRAAAREPRRPDRRRRGEAQPAAGEPGAARRTAAPPAADAKA